MNVLLVEPNFVYSQYPPLGLLKLASIYRKYGYNVTLVRKNQKYNNDSIPDLICITSLFTYSWKAVINSYSYYRNKFKKSQIIIGGIYASLMPGHVRKYCPDAEIYKGVIEEGDLILPAWDLVPEWKSSIIFTSRGCPNKCKFCAVRCIEPVFKPLDVEIRNLIYPGHNKIIIQDNNILADKNHWEKIYRQLKEINLKVDFNQGLDASLIDEEVAFQLKSLKIDYIRIAYDSTADREFVKNAIINLKKVGIRGKNIFVYTLFNFEDSPEDFLNRVKDLMEWEVVVYPMRYEPNNSLEKNKYIAPKWTAEELEMVAKARRVIGWGGALVPHEGLKKKILFSNNFYEAFVLREVS